jgi:hypothetical protein
MKEGLFFIAGALCMIPVIVAIANHHRDQQWREWNQRMRYGFAPDGMDRNGEKNLSENSVREAKYYDEILD